MIIDLALEYMDNEVTPGKSILKDQHVPPLPHNTAIFDLHVRPINLQMITIDVVSVHQKQCGQLMPPPHVLQHLVDTYYPLLDHARIPGGVRITYFTELPVNNSIVRAHPAYKQDGPCFDYVMLVDLEDDDGRIYLVPAHVELIYYYPSHPDKRYVVVHPAYEFHYSHSVLTSFHRMQYQDDPNDIMESDEIINYDTDKKISITTPLSHCPLHI
jgi:hypothetical protein